MGRASKIEQVMGPYYPNKDDLTNIKEGLEERQERVSNLGKKMLRNQGKITPDMLDQYRYVVADTTNMAELAILLAAEIQDDALSDENILELKYTRKFQ